MSQSSLDGFRIAGVRTCVPPRVIDNLECGESFGGTDVRKVVAMAGVRQRHVVDENTTAADLCFEAAAKLLDELGWARESVTGLIFVTQSPDYFLPSTSCVVHRWLGLADTCATFDVGLGCSGYPYGLYLAATMLRGGGQSRILVLHGETPSRFTSPDDHATTLLFGDAGSATAVEHVEDASATQFALYTDGKGYDGLIVRGGGFRDRTPADPRRMFLEMDGAGVFNFTIKRVPPLVRDTLAFASLGVGDIDLFALHQSNRFMMKHLIKKCGMDETRAPILLERYGNVGGPSVPLVLTHAGEGASRRVMMIGYGVGLSWSAAITKLDASARLAHAVYAGDSARA